MARIRSIKPEFWTSAQIVECSTNARLLFIGLWNFCDDAGRHPESVKQIKAEIFPADEFSLDDVSRMIDELSSNGLLRRYEVDSKGYLQVTGWHHQRIDRPNAPRYPGPKGDSAVTARRAIDDRSCLKGEDRKGKDRKGSKRRTRPPEAGDARASPGPIPADWQPNETNRQWLVDAGLTDEDQAELVGEFVRWARNAELHRANWQLSFARNPVVKSAVGRAKAGRTGSHDGRNRKTRFEQLFGDPWKNRNDDDDEDAEQARG